MKYKLLQGAGADALSTEVDKYIADDDWQLYYGPFSPDGKMFYQTVVDYRVMIGLSDDEACAEAVEYYSIPTELFKK